MRTINYNGNKYNAEIIESYYDTEICVMIDADTDQEFFDKYIQLNPGFLDLFDYDFYPVIEED